MSHKLIVGIIVLMLSGCAGGVSGLMSSSPPGMWKIYRIKYQTGMNAQLQRPVNIVLEDMFFKLGFKQKRDWGRPILANARVTSFQQQHRGREIYVNVEIANDEILIMSTSYSSVTSDMFERLDRLLNETFGKDNIESCFGMKDTEGRTCLKN